MTTVEKIRVLLARRNIPEAELARRLGKTPQNFNRKMKVERFTEEDLEAIAKALNCTVIQAVPVFRMNESGEEI
ncbi:conserved domain protein [Leadbettera azotonutricia ZAS-9]|uniref:Conserved domain protein n=2 Tax=Leadbettera azotonutricia TaxID=150829 RepID=F5YFN8_LEAAZ|nr:conserved domain protein [Leadbettera azotonutricia ZAS-9]